MLIFFFAVFTLTLCVSPSPCLNLCDACSTFALKCSSCHTWGQHSPFRSIHGDVPYILLYFSFWKNCSPYLCLTYMRAKYARIKDSGHHFTGYRHHREILTVEMSKQRGGGTHDTCKNWASTTCRSERMWPWPWTSQWHHLGTSGSKLVNVLEQNKVDL